MLNLGIELLSPKNLPRSVCQAFAGCTAATWGAGAFYSHAFIQCLAQRRTSAAAKLALFITPKINVIGQKVGEEEYKSDTSLLGLLSAPSLLPVLSLFPSKGSLLFLSLPCQDEMTFELC